MDGESAVQEVGSSQDSGGIDQSSYVNDAWNDNYFNSHESELNPQPAQAKTPKEEVKDEVKPEAQAPKDPTVQEPVKQEPQRSLFEQAFSGENGDLDVEKFLGFNIPEAEAAIEADIGTPEAETGVKQEQWQKDMEELNTLSTTLTENLLSPLEKVYELIQQGTDPELALKQIYDERKQFMDKHLNEVKSQKEFQRQKALEDSINERTRNEQMIERVKTNSNELISNLPGKDYAEKRSFYNEVLFGKDIGAHVLNREFNKAYPDNAKMTPKARSKAAEKFVNSIQADKAELRYVFKQCLNEMKVQNLPKAMQAERLRAIADHKSNSLAAQKNPLGTSKRIAPAAKPGLWDGYFNSHADRV